ncbi:MAG TPA: hypothetical protein VK862_09550 [Afifellaceae bacterium]|nr:hypothetical protein [Afifellaceae bacterium]
MLKPTLALVAAAIALQPAAPALAGSHFKPSFKGARQDAVPQFNPETLRRNLCVDLAVKLEPYVSHHPRWGNRPAVRVIIVNVSNVDYVSGPNQQQVQTSFSKRGLGTAIDRFGNIPAGGRVMLGGHGTGSGVTATARIVFDPDIRNDGNPANDDCRAGNNRVAVRTD